MSKKELSAYDKIMNMKSSGSKEIKEMVEQWERLSNNIDRYRPETPVLLPNYLLISPSGTRKTEIFGLLAEYLKEKRLLEFAGEEMVYEFHLDYVKMSDNGEYKFRELERLVAELRDRARFHQVFQGVLAINITDWKQRDSMDSREMSLLLEYLADNEKNGDKKRWLMFFVLDAKDEKTVSHAYSVLSAYTRVNLIHLKHDTPEEMLQESLRQLKEYGFTCTAKAKKILLEDIQILAKQEYFDGYKTMRSFIQEIVYQMYSRNEEDISKLTDTMLEEFYPEGEYIKQLKEINGKRKFGL